jgi:hypothetical protein
MGSYQFRITHTQAKTTVKLPDTDSQIKRELYRAPWAPNAIGVSYRAKTPAGYVPMRRFVKAEDPQLPEFTDDAARQGLEIILGLSR